MVYVDNKLFYTEDPYERRTYYNYDSVDMRPIRTITGLVPEYELDDFAAVAAETRDASANADYIVTDMAYDVVGNQTSTTDPRGFVTSHEYDSRDRRTATIAADGNAAEARTETIYDLASNVIEVRSPRYFAAGDSEGHQKARETWTYTDSGNVATHVEAPGTTIAATESFTYDLLGRRITHTNFGGHVSEIHHEDCCGQVTASEDPLGHGSYVRKDASGRNAHSVLVQDYDDHVASLDNPVDAKTLRETTTKFDGRGRPVASTTWLVARGTVDVTNPPIAGLAGVAAADGLTTQYLYDDDLADGSGLDVAGGLTPLLGGSAINLTAAITKLGQSEANGGGGITFDADSGGSARVTLNPEGEIRFAIADAAGRSVMSGMLDPSNNSLITWSCSVHDETEVVGGKTYLVSKRVDALGNTTKSYSDAGGRTIQSADALGKLTTMTYDAGGNRLSVRDPNNVGQDCIYDALGRETQCTDTVGSVTKSVYDKAGNKITATDAKNEDTTYTFDARGRQIKQTDRNGGITQFAYTALGQLQSLTDAESQVTSYTYDAAGTKLTETYPDHVSGSAIGSAGYGIVTFTPDAAGRTSVRQDQ